MPSLEYQILFWILRIIVICIACALGILSVRGYRKKKIIIPCLQNLFAYIILWFGCYEVIILVYQCENDHCAYTRTDIYHGVLGIKIFQGNIEMAAPENPPLKCKLVRTVEIRYWGGLVAAFPHKNNLRHKLSTTTFFIPPIVYDRPFPRTYILKYCASP
jgi:hypothetical protein